MSANAILYTNLNKCFLQRTLNKQPLFFVYLRNFAEFIIIAIYLNWHKFYLKNLKLFVLCSQNPHYFINFKYFILFREFIPWYFSINFSFFDISYHIQRPPHFWILLHKTTRLEIGVKSLIHQANHFATNLNIKLYHIIIIAHTHDGHRLLHFSFFQSSY